MRITTPVLSGTLRLGRIADLSREASKRLKWFEYYERHGRNARLTCRYFGISPQTFYRWKRRYNPKNLGSLEDYSRRPRHVRQPTYSAELVESVLKLREEYPRWGKEKLATLLNERGHPVSVSMVGRILHRLKERGVLKEPIPNHISARKRQRSRQYATRKPKDYRVAQPGDLVELDTLDIRPLPGVVIKHLTAHDVISRWNVIEAHGEARASTAAHFLDTLQARMPFKVEAIQVDGGAEFESIFEEECRRRGIRLFILPPRSPKLNGGVERAHRTHTEEFYEVTDCSFSSIAELAIELLKWEHTYNTIRPHQALGYLTPLKFLEQERKEVRCH